MLILPATAEVIAGFIAAAEAAPDELSTIANVMPCPPMPFVPEEQHGKLVIFALMAYAGETEAGERALAPFRALATPIADMLKPMPYPEIYRPDEAEADYHPLAIARTMFVDRIDRSVAETIMEHLEASDAPMRVAQLRVLGGAMARVPADATAFAHRQPRIMVNVAAFYEGPDDRERARRGSTSSSPPCTGRSRAPTSTSSATRARTRIRAAYPGATWDRLAAIKGRYDPTNLFRLNQNIPPATDVA